MKDQWTDRLSDYLDGDLGVAERGALEAHLAARPACEATLDELRRVVARAQALDDRPPATDLWPAIAEQIGVSSGAHRVVSLAAHRARRRVSLTVPQLAAAAAVLLLLGSGGAYLALHRSTQDNRPLARRQTGIEPVTATIGWVLKTSASYDAAVAELQGALEQGRKSGRLDSATVRVLTQSLVTIDSAIVQARRAPAAPPPPAPLESNPPHTPPRQPGALPRGAAPPPPPAVGGEETAPFKRRR